MFVKEEGSRDSPMLVLIHGGGVSGWMWGRQVDYFQNCYRVVPDLPGHGKSRDIPFQSINDTARQIIEIIQNKRNGREVTLAGFSLGAQIAVEVLSLQPEIADYAVINSALVIPMKSIRPFLRPMTKLSMPLAKNRRFAKLQAKALYVGEEQFEAYYKVSSSMSTDTLLRILEENMSYRIPPGFGQSHAKILILAGGREKKAILQSAAALAESNDYCAAYTVPGIGHGISLAAPGLFNQILVAWMTDTDLPEGARPLNGQRGARSDH